MIAALGAGTLFAGLPFSGPLPEDTHQDRNAEAGRTRGETTTAAGAVLKRARGDKEANDRRAERMIRSAAAGGAKLIRTTECFLDGYAIADKGIPLEAFRAPGEPIPDGAYCRRPMYLADELDVIPIAGMLEAQGEARKTAALVGIPARRQGEAATMAETQRSMAGRTSS